MIRLTVVLGVLLAVILGLIRKLLTDYSTPGSKLRGASRAQQDAKACPRCGSSDLEAEPHKRVHCKSCDALGPSPIDQNGINQNNAIELWNRGFGA